MSKKNVVKSILGLSSISVITAAVGFIIVPISTRLINSTDLGKISMVQSVVNILLSCLFIGLDHGYIRKYYDLDDKKKKSLFSFSFYIVILLNVIFLLISTFFWEEISYSVIGERRFDILFIISISTISYSVERILLTQYRLSDAIGKYAFVSIIFMLANKVIYVLAAFFVPPTYIVLLYVMVISELVVSILVLVLNRKLFTFHGFDSNELIDSIKFGLPIMGSFVVYQINQYLPRFFLKSNVGFSDVGIFSTAITISSVITLLQNGFALVWTPFVYENHQKMKSEINKMQEILVILLTLFSSLIIVFQYLLVYVVGEKYRAMTFYLPILIIFPVLNSLGEITGIGINIAKRTKLHLVNNLVTLIITLIFCVLFVPSYGSLGAAIAVTGGCFTLFLLRTYEGRKLYNPVENNKYIIFCVIIFAVLAVSNCMFYNNLVLLHITFLFIILFELFFFRDKLLDVIKYSLLIVKKRFK